MGFSQEWDFFGKNHFIRESPLQFFTFSAIRNLFGLKKFHSTKGSLLWFVWCFHLGKKRFLTWTVLWVFCYCKRFSVCFKPIYSAKKLSRFSNNEKNWGPARDSNPQPPACEVRFLTIWPSGETLPRKSVHQVDRPFSVSFVVWWNNSNSRAHFSAINSTGKWHQKVSSGTEILREFCLRCLASKSLLNYDIK